MQIFVKCLKGKTIVFEVNGNNTGEEVKALVGEKTGNEPDTFNLIYAGRWIEGIETISDYKVQKESPLHMSPKWGTQTQCEHITHPPEFTEMMDKFRLGDVDIKEMMDKFRLGDVDFKEMIDYLNRSYC